MKETGQIIIAFSTSSWKPFISEAEAIEFIKEEELGGEYWSLTTGRVEFYIPYLEEPLGYQIQDVEVISTRYKCSK